MREMSLKHPPARTSAEREYWLFQFAAWAGFTVLNYLSLTIWYNPGEWAPALHTALQSVLGLLVSHPLRIVARYVWNAGLPTRFFANATAILLASILWTVLRLASFEWLTGEHVDPGDWGGWFNASVMVYGAWAFCLHALKYYRDWSEERALVAQAQRAALEAQAREQSERARRIETEALANEAKLRMLRYQLSPHFLFNALNAVSARVLQGDAESAASMLAKIGDFLRVTLEHDEELWHSLDAEIEILNLYLEIEKARFGERLQTEFEISREALQVEVPSLLLQPLFENAVKYAVGKSLTPTRVQLNAWLENGWLEVRVSDTGPGIQLKDGENGASTGIGLRNVEHRLQSAHAGAYRFELYANRPQGTTVAMAFPASLAKIN